MIAVIALILATDSPAFLAVQSKGDLKLLDEHYETLKTIHTDAVPVAWSRNGTYVALSTKDHGIQVLDTRDAKSPLLDTSPGSANPSWDRSGNLLFCVPGKGLLRGIPGGEYKLILPNVTSAIPGFDGSSITFSNGDGLWVANADGSSARRLLSGKYSGTPSWSGDGRWIAIVIDGHLKLVRPNGRKVKDLGLVDGPIVSCSSGSPYLVALRNKSWSVWNFQDEKWQSIELDTRSAPQWVGPRRLLGLINGVPNVFSLVGSPKPVFDGEASAVSQVVGTYMGAAFPNPYLTAQKPNRSSLSVRGHVTSVDPIVGKISVKIEVEENSRGKQKVFGTPETRTYNVLAPKLMKRLTLLPESEVALLVSGTEVKEAQIPDEELIAGAPVLNHTPRFRRQTEYDGVSLDHVVVPMIYPIPGKHKGVDTFLADRDGGKRRHHGNDLMAPKMTPLLAVFDGTVSFWRTDTVGAHNMLSITSDDGYVATYMHINNDNPGTNDNSGSLRYAFPADLQPGQRVVAGQIVAYCGNSGNAEQTAPHLHFELSDMEGGGVLDPYYSLKAAPHLDAPRYIDPDPNLKPKTEETRWDIVVTEVNPTLRTIVGELCGLSGTHGRIIAATKPRRVYLQFHEGAMVKFRGGSDIAYPIDAIRGGFRLSATGKVEGAKLTVNVATMSLP